MEGDFDQDITAIGAEKLDNPERKDTEIPYFKIELAEDIDPTSDEAKRLSETFRGYNHLVSLFRSELSDEELEGFIPASYRTLNAIVKNSDEYKADPTLASTIPEAEIKDDDPIKLIEIKNEVDLRKQLSQASIFTHSLGNISYVVEYVRYAQRHVQDSITANDDILEPVDVRDRLHTTLLNAQEIFSDEIILENISGKEFGAKFGAIMRAILGEHMVDVVTNPRIDDQRLNIPIYWLYVLAADLAQNIQRKQQETEDRVQTAVYFSPAEVQETLKILVEDSGKPYTEEIIQNKFARGRGENAGGQHIAMAAHSEMAVRVGGSIEPNNDYVEDEDTYYPQTITLVPYDVKVD